MSIVNFTVKREYLGVITYLNQGQSQFVSRQSAGRFTYKKARDLARQWRPADGAAYSIDEAPAVHPADWLIALSQFLEHIKDVEEYRNSPPPQILEEWKYTNADGQTLWRIMVLIDKDVLYWAGIGETVDRRPVPPMLFAKQN